MGVCFFQNGSNIGASAAWGGYTGANNYVVRYDFVTPASGASGVTVALSGIYNGHSPGTQGFGFKLGTTSYAWANARAQTPDSTLGYMSYSSATGYGCTMSAQGLNLAPYTTYYLFVYMATAGAEYYTGWNCTAPAITLSGSYTPPGSTISSMSGQVTTRQTASIIMNRAANCWHRASFYCGGELLAQSAPFAAALSQCCEREWLSKATDSASARIDVAVQTYTDEGCTAPTGEVQTGYFTLTADEDMRPRLSTAAVSVQAVNAGEAASFTEAIATMSRIKVKFDTEKIDLSACAGAARKYCCVRFNGRVIKTEGDEIDLGILPGGCTLTCSCIDTRGREGGVNVAAELYSYVKPSLSELSAERCTASGASDEAGAYIRLRAVLAYTPLGGKNSAAVSASLQPTGAPAGAETPLTGFESGVWSNAWSAPTLLGGALDGDSYTLRLRVKDAVGGEGVYSVQLYHRRWAMKFNENGTAIGFGMAPTAANAVMLAASWRLYTGGIVLSESAYGAADPEQAVTSPVEGQLYFKLKE